MSWQIDRKEFIEELELRSFIRESILKVKKHRLEEEEGLRSVIKEIIAEANDKKKEELARRAKQPWYVNLLEDLLNETVPQVERFMVGLSEPAQLKSFRAHFIHAIQDTLSTILPDGIPKIADAVDEPLGELTEQEKITVDVDPEDAAPDEGDEELAAAEEDLEEPEEELRYELPGYNRLGADRANKAFAEVEEQLKDGYKTALKADDGSEKAREEISKWYRYLITNWKLNFDKIQNQMQLGLEEPSTPEYEQEKAELEAAGKLGAEEPPGAEPEEEMGGLEDLEGMLELNAKVLKSLLK